MFCARTWQHVLHLGVLHLPNDGDTDQPLGAVLNLKVSKGLKAQVLLLSRPLCFLVTVSLVHSVAATRTVDWAAVRGRGVAVPKARLS